MAEPAAEAEQPAGGEDMEEEELDGGAAAEDELGGAKKVDDPKAWMPGQVRGLIGGDAGLKERQNPSYICPSCGNMLWNFRNDASTGKLHRVCRNCSHRDEMESNLVYMNDLKFEGGMDHVASADMVKDPTLARATNVDCLTCHFNEAVFFQKPMRGQEGMKLIFMCIRCAYRWEQ